MIWQEDFYMVSISPAQATRNSANISLQLSKTFSKMPLPMDAKIWLMADKY
jgi:hypothetical protein